MSTINFDDVTAALELGNSIFSLSHPDNDSQEKFQFSGDPDNIMFSNTTVGRKGFRRYQFGQIHY